MRPLVPCENHPNQSAHACGICVGNLELRAEQAEARVAELAREVEDWKGANRILSERILELTATASVGERRACGCAWNGPPCSLAECITRLERAGYPVGKRGAPPDCGCTDGTDPHEPADRGFICPHDPRGAPRAETAPDVRDAMLRKALDAWSVWYSDRLDRIARGARGEDYSGYEQDLFEALGCVRAPFAASETGCTRCERCNGTGVCEEDAGHCSECEGSGRTPKRSGAT